MRRKPDPAALARRAARGPVDTKPIIWPVEPPNTGEPKATVFATSIRVRLAEMDVQLAEALAESGRFSADVWLKAFQEEDRRR
jgi:hypothetical protein